MGLQKFDHHIQAEIFAKLRRNPTVRYKDLRDPTIESSLFAYHLKELIANKVVEKVGRGEYCLAPKGITLAQQFSGENKTLQSGPLTYTLIFLRSKTGKWLVMTRQQYPYIGRYACISGKLHMEETIEQAKQRELNHFTSGLIETDLMYKGYVSIMIQDHDNRTHITGPVWFADNVDEVDLPSVRQGSFVWADWKELDYEKFIPGWKEIVEMIESDSSLYLDLAFKL